MELHRYESSIHLLDEVAAYANVHTVLFDCTDGDTILAATKLGRLTKNAIGLWLHVGPEYPASLAARDVKTLSHLLRLDHVAISATERPQAHASIVRAMLEGDDVTMTTKVARVKHAFNQPRPRRALKVWWVEGEELVSDGLTFAKSIQRPPASGVTVYS
jgi:hypothetical protein